MLNPKERIEKLIADFSAIATWEDRYKRLIDMGKALPPMDPVHQTEDNKVKGCQSQVWLTVKLQDNKTLHFEADSDALIVKGLISLLLNVYQDLAPADILQTPPRFLADLGLESHLSPSRANGLQAMAKQIQYYATAYQFLLSKQN
jgi:cysteine desulfuration protein SufE